VSLEGFEPCSYSFNRKYLKPQFLQHGENFSVVKVRKSHLVIAAMEKNIFLRVDTHTHTHTYMA